MNTHLNSVCHCSRGVISSSQCLQSTRYLSADGCNLALVHAGLGHHVSQRAASQVLHHHPQLVSYQVAATKKKNSMWLVKGVQSSVQIKVHKKTKKEQKKMMLNISLAAIQ